MPPPWPGLVLALALDSVLPAKLSALANVFWWAWFVLVGRALWKVLEWRHDWFVATDKRLILTYGLITQKVAMMPLAKVTDMSYNRSPVGRLLGYGTFVMESAGQDQALHRVGWVADPDRTYRAICAEIFGVDDPQARPGRARAPRKHAARATPPLSGSALRARQALTNRQPRGRHRAHILLGTRVRLTATTDMALLTATLPPGQSPLRPDAQLTTRR